MHYVDVTLVEKIDHGPHTFVLRLGDCQGLTETLPGQFVMLRGEWGRDPLLPRAFSIQSVTPAGIAEILVKTVGRGTALLETALPGARFKLLGPLGTSFPAPRAERDDWLVAGGVGLAPLLFHAERAARLGCAGRLRLFYGGRSARDLVLLDRLEGTGIVMDLCTDDGTRGFAGRVTAAVEAALLSAARTPTLMACGPDPMLIAVAEIAHRRALEAFLSLEGEMACGIGVCLGCAVPCATKPYRYTCKDGPVMELGELRGPYAPRGPLP
jgi:dihydroorotate dehydrogenase electron transfer subunit